MQALFIWYTICSQQVRSKKTVFSALTSKLNMDLINKGLESFRWYVFLPLV